MLGKAFTYFKDITGTIAPMTAVLLPVLLGATGLGVDVSVWMKNKRDLQAAADAAVIAAAWDIAYGSSDERAETSGRKEAANNGFTPGGSNSLNFQFSENDEGRHVISAQLRSQDTTYFSKIVYRGDIFTAAAAASAVIEPAGDYCMLSLNRTADGAISANGTVDVTSLGCGIAINSNSDSALDLIGTVDVNVKDLNIVGGYETGDNVTLNTQSTRTNGRSTPDPYEDLETPDDPQDLTCDYRNKQVNGDADFYPEQGNITVFCNGLSIRGNGDVTFAPGIYYILDGDFTVSGGGTITADRASFILSSSDGDGGDVGQLNISGGKEMEFTAPDADDDMGGVVFYQDRIAEESNQCNSLVGSAALDVIGTIYFPSQCLDIGGNADAIGSADDPCSRIIADTINLHGTPNIGNNCEGLGVEDIGLYSVRLIL